MPTRRWSSWASTSGTRRTRRRCSWSSFGVAYSTGVDTDGAIALEYGVRGIPEKFFIDSDGVVRRKYVGPMPEDVLRGVLDELLLEASAPGG